MSGLFLVKKNFFFLVSPSNLICETCSCLVFSFFFSFFRPPRGRQRSRGKKNKNAFSKCQNWAWPPWDHGGQMDFCGPMACVRGSCVVTKKKPPWVPLRSTLGCRLGKRKKSNATNESLTVLEWSPTIRNSFGQGKRGEFRVLNIEKDKIRNAFSFSMSRLLTFSPFHRWKRSRCKERKRERRRRINFHHFFSHLDQFHIFSSSSSYGADRFLASRFMKSGQGSIFSPLDDRRRIRKFQARSSLAESFFFSYKLLIVVQKEE